MKPFKRVSSKKAWCLGVLGGVAHMLDVPATPVRFGFLAFCLLGAGIPFVFVYFLLGALAPMWEYNGPEGFEE
jgi:phage shock protein PspC (stress-responsive transcriptional regulator)